MAQLNDLIVLGNTSLIGPIKANSDHDLLAHTNEFNYASPKFSGDIYINYRTASGSDGAISSYRFCKGAGSTLANVYATTFYGALSGNATSSTTATKFSSARTIALTGDVSGTASADGSSGWSISTTVVDNSHNHGYLSGWADTRSAATAPNDYNGQFKVVGIKQKSLMDIDGSGYSSLIGFRGWSDSSGGNAHELAFTGNGNLYHRQGSTTTWSSWNRIPMCGTDNTFSGTNTFSGQVVLSRTTDADGTTDTEPALRIGAISGTHLELDGNEIMAKSDATHTGPLYLNNNGGQVNIGSGGLKVSGTIEGTLSGNASTASRLTDITSTDVASSSATQRYVFISYNDLTTGRPAYDTRFTFQTSTGILTAPIFAGSGANLTSLNASNISTGTLAAARLPNHVSTATTYGVGDATHYGHVLLYPAASCTSYTSDSGGACTPAAVKKAVETFGRENSQKTGDILLSSNPTIPDGYLRCDGREITTSNYSNLYKVLPPDYLTWGQDTLKSFPDSSVADSDNGEYLEYILNAEGYHIARLDDDYANSYFYYTTDPLSNSWTRCTSRGYHFSYCNGYFIQTTSNQKYGFYYGNTPASFTLKRIDNMSSDPSGPICYMNGLYMAYDSVYNNSINAYNVVLYYCSTINGTWSNKIITTRNSNESVKMVDVNHQTILFVGNKMLILSVSSNQPRLSKTITLNSELTDIDGIKYFNSWYYLYGRKKNEKYFLFRHSSLNFDQAPTNYAPPKVDYHEGGIYTWAEYKSDLIYNNVDKNYIFATSSGLMYTQDVSKGWIPGYMYMPSIATGTSSDDELQFFGLHFVNGKLLLRGNDSYYVDDFSTKHLPNINTQFFSRSFPYTRSRVEGTVYAYIKY